MKNEIDERYIAAVEDAVILLLKAKGDGGTSRDEEDKEGQAAE